MDLVHQNWHRNKNYTLDNFEIFINWTKIYIKKTIIAKCISGVEINKKLFHYIY
jgi:hypothetical protein